MRSLLAVAATVGLLGSGCGEDAGPEAACPPHQLWDEADDRCELPCGAGEDCHGLEGLEHCNGSGDLAGCASDCEDGLCGLDCDEWCESPCAFVECAPGTACRNDVCFAAPCSPVEPCHRRFACVDGVCLCPGGDPPVSFDGACACSGPADCYAEHAYCASDERCYDALPGAPGNDCPEALAAEAMEAGAPLLASSRPVAIGFPAGTSCKKDPANCANNGNVCAFELHFHDPDGDAPRTLDELLPRTSWLSGTQPAIRPFDLEAPDLAAGTFVVLGCFPEIEAYPRGAVQLEDLAGHRSNAHCVEGSAW